MSLRDKLEQNKAAKMAEKETEAVSSKEKETASVKQQLAELIAKRAAIVQMKEGAASSRSGMKEAKNLLKAERSNLRALHEESKDEETGEALLPKPTELVRGEEFQGEEEIQSYGQAREAFRLSVENIKENEKQLSEIGIENAGELSPEQLNSELEKREKEINDEARAFVLEYPDADPEFAAEVRKEIVLEREGELRITQNMHGKRSEFAESTLVQTAFYRSVTGDRGTKAATLDEAIDVSVRALSDPERADDRKKFVERFNTVPLEGGVDEEISRDALARAIAWHMAIGDPVYSTSGKADRLLAKERESEGGLPLEKEKTNNYAEQSEALRDRIAADPRVIQAAEQIMLDQKVLTEAKETESSLKQDKDRLENIDKELSEQGFVTYDSSGRTIEHKSPRETQEEIERRASALGTEKAGLAAQVATLAEFPQQKAELSNRYDSLLDEPVYLSKERDPQIGLRTFRDSERDSLNNENQAAKTRLEELTTLRSGIENEKDGILGTNKKSKAERLQKANNEADDVQKKIDEREVAIRNLDREKESFESSISKDLENYVGLAKLGGFEKGTLSELLNAMEDGVLKGKIELKQKGEDIATKEQALANEREEHTNKIDGLRQERSDITERVQLDEDKLRRLKKDLEKRGHA